MVLALLSVFLLLSLSPRACSAQVWTTYTNTGYVSGLDSQNGDLWAGTAGGVVHWNLPAGDPVKYTTSEGLADQWVKEVLIDSAGNRWFGTVEGVQKFDGSNWTVYNTANSPLPHNTVYSIVQDLDGVMWFGTSFGCASFDGGNWEVFTNLGGGATNVAVRGIDVDSQNRIWTANNPDGYGDPGGVSMYDGVTWTYFNPDPGSSIGQYFLSLVVGNDDRVWAGSWTNWLFVYDGSTWTHYTSGNSGLVGNNIESFEVEDDGTIWIGNHEAYVTPSTGGVTKYDNGAWTSYTPANSGLPNGYIYAIAATDETVYFGTGYVGIAAFDGVSWDYLEVPGEPYSNWYTTITEGEIGDDNALYFGTDHAGISVYNGSDWISYRSDNSGLGDNYINDLHLIDGDLWVGAQFTGLWRFNGAAWQNWNSANSGLLGDIVLSLDTDSQGNLWLGNVGWDGPGALNGALTRFDGAIWTHYHMENSGLISDDNLKVQVAPDDAIWVGTEAGVSRFDGNYGWASYHTGNSGLQENHVQAIAFGSAGEVWFATRGGVSRLTGAAWTGFTTADGLPGNNVQDIRVSEQGVVWAATSTGVASYTEMDGWTAYTQTDGLADNDIRTLWLETEDELWFGSYKSGLGFMLSDLTGIESPQDGSPSADLRVDSWPNPFNPTTRISFTLTEPGRVMVRIFDIQGRQVASLADGHFDSGTHNLSWDARSDTGTAQASGIYYVAVQQGGEVATTKLVLLK